MTACRRAQGSRREGGQRRSTEKLAACGHITGDGDVALAGAAVPLF